MATKQKPSPMPLAGIIQVTGFHDTGKTTFALECGVAPDKICFFDSDIKGKSTVMDLQAQGITFGAYHDLTALADGKKPLEYHNAVMQLLDTIEPGQFECIIFDPWEIGNTTHDYVLANRAKFRDVWSPNGRIKGAQEWGVARDYEAMILNRLSSIARTIILVTHLRPLYVNSAKVPGKEVPGGSKILDRICRLRLWLTSNGSGRPVPVGLVLKRIDTKSVVEGRLRTVSVLPRKLTPNDSESSLWDTIERYWLEPIGDRPPTADETPDEFELSLIDGTLTGEQKRMFDTMLDQGLVDGGDEPLGDLASGEREQIEAELKGGSKPVAVASKLGIALPLVLEVHADLMTA